MSARAPERMCTASRLWESNSQRIDLQSMRNMIVRASYAIDFLCRIKLKAACNL